MAKGSDFGAFFREARKALGLNLREFCRQTGYDPGNISRLERGELSPPKKQKLISEYAMALKLEPGSARWETFMALAKPGVNANRGFGQTSWVRAIHLEGWAQSTDCRHRFPQLLRRLIRATAAKTPRLEFPSGEQTQRLGWDGWVVHSDGDSEFVPEGMSRWEMGTGNDPKKKVEEDFAKHTNEVSAMDRRAITFVFVTPRKWQKKTEWVDEKAKLGKWKEVRVYDSATIEEWLETAPAVDVWLAEQIGTRPTGVIDVETAWKNLESLTQPNFQPAVFLASRENQVTKIGEFLNWGGGSFAIQASSPREGLDFVLAASQLPEFAGEFAARAILVSTREAWRSLTRSPSSLILIADPKLDWDEDLVVQATRSGHQVFTFSDRPILKNQQVLKLNRITRHDLQMALEDQGIAGGEAFKLARESRANLTILKRLKAVHPGKQFPDWSEKPEALPFLLAGAWEDNCEGDRNALAFLAGHEYGQVREHAERLSKGPDPLLIYRENQWQILSREDSWCFAPNLLTDEALKRSEDVAIQVLGEIASGLEVPAEEVWRVGFAGRRGNHSESLRRGIAQTLALLGAQSKDFHVTSPSMENFAASIVEKLLKKKSWKTWASLSGFLPLLAEAAPEEVLDALEFDLSRPSPEVLWLFDDKAQPLLGPNWQTGLLFSLEILAWNEDFLARSSLILAQLYERTKVNPRLKNPLRSMEQIFMPWFPQTTATVEDRIKVLNKIARTHPKAGWKLLKELLPAPGATGGMNQRPQFRDWEIPDLEPVSASDQALQVQAISSFLIEIGQQHPAHLKELLEVVEKLPQNQRISLLEEVKRIDPETISTEERLALAEVVRQKVNRHRRFEYTKWALKGDWVNDLESILNRIELPDPITKHAWLFADYWKVFHEVARGDFAKPDATEKSGNRVRELRTEALQEIRASQGWEGILALAAKAAKPDQVGETVALVFGDSVDRTILPELLGGPNLHLREMAKGFVWERQKRKGSEWIHQLDMRSWTTAEVIEFALALPPGPLAWDFVADRGQDAESQYWSKLNRFTDSPSKSDVTHAAISLSRVGQAQMAVGQVEWALIRSMAVDSETIFAVLEALPKAEGGPIPFEDLFNRRHELAHLIGELQKRWEAKETDFDEERLANLEWAFLEFLDGDPTGPTVLHRRLAHKPEFLIELLRVLYRRSDESDDGSPETPGNSGIKAQQAYRLLMSWNLVPGTVSDGSIDFEKLEEWVRTVQVLARKESRLEVAEGWIGSVLAHAPEETDGSWPCIPVRDVIEDFGTEAMKVGFFAGEVNGRGVSCRPDGEGGTLEREGAKKYGSLAEGLRSEWPKTAAWLREIAKSYERDALRADLDALKS